MSTATDQPVRVARFWTRARRFPQLIGKALNGERLWGGPYTITQAIVGFLLGFTLWKTRGIWGPDSIVTQAMVIVLITGGTVWALGKVPLNTRNPIITVLGIARSVTAPRGGPVTRSRRSDRRPGSRRFAIPSPPAPVWPGPSTRAATDTAEPQTETPTPAAEVAPHNDRPLATQPPSSKPLTGLQQLLADAARNPHNADTDEDWESAGRRVQSNLTGVSKP